MLLTVENRRERNLAVLRLSGKLDGSGCDLIRARIAGLLSSGTESFLINLAKIDDLNELGIGSLASIAAQVRAQGGQISLTRPKPELCKFLDLAGIASAFDFCDSEADFVDSSPVLENAPDPNDGLMAQVGGPPSAVPRQPRVTSQTARYIGAEAALEVIDPILGTRLVSITKSPFLIGRAPDNDLLLFDKRISRHSASIAFAEGAYRIRDKRDRSGTYVNGQQTSDQVLNEGDQVDFGLSDSFTLVFHLRPLHQSIDRILTQLDEHRELDPRARALNQMSLLLEASALVYSQLPMEDILAAVVDRAIELTGADRGALIEKDDSGKLRVIVARQQGARPVSPDQLRFLRIQEDEVSPAVRDAQDLMMVTTWNDSRSGSGEGSIARNEIWCCLPLSEPAVDGVEKAEPRGGLYLETGRTAGFRRESMKTRLQQEQILKALAVQAAGVLNNARLVERELERSRLDQELAIAHRIQQALLPQSTKRYAHAVVTGINRPCYSVGGDYFDHMELGSDHLAFIIADVSGKGLSAALVTTMLQGTMSAMTLGSSPTDVFNHTNQFMCQHSVERHVTLFFGTIRSDGELRYINAGHHPPLLVRNGRIQRAFEDGCMPLGLMPHIRVVEGTTRLDPGDLLFLYTDGIPEATNSQGEEFGMHRLEESLRLSMEGSVSAIQDSILGRLKAFTAGNDPADDITMLILRYEG